LEVLPLIGWQPGKLVVHIHVNFTACGLLKFI